MIGKIISHYRILERLGGGGMGVVYKAEDTKLHRTVALKFLPPELTRDDEAKQRFIHEAQTASSLDHNNICTVHEIDETVEGQLFICMNYYDGETLKKKIEKGPLKLEEAIDITIQIAQGLYKAHEQKIIHRDIKPANIFITKDGIIKILDFGLAKLSGQTMITKIGSTVGTVAYMSPEQARGEVVDHRTDIWSLGVVLYEMITGKLPFKGDYDQAIIYGILNEEPTPMTTLRTDVSGELNRIVSKTMAKNPSERYQQINEMLEELQLMEEGFKHKSTESEKQKKNKLMILFATAVPIVIIGVLLWLYLPTRHEEVIDSIAVLPFENLSADPEQEYFSDGMTEALITELSKIKALRVISRTSIMHFKKTEKTLPEIARELNVKAIVEGSVQRVGNMVRINAQLVRAEPEEHLWAKPFTRNLAKILELQSEVAQAIANEIRITVTPEERKQLASSHPVNPEAHEAYLKGRFFINKFNETDVRKGISYFEQAIAKDSNYALAYEGLAEGHDYLFSLGMISAKNAFPKIKTLAMKALSIDKDLAEAYAIIGDIESSEWNWQGAEENFKQAFMLNQNYAIGHAAYAYYLLMMKRYDEALSEGKHAVEVDPLWPFAKVVLAWTFFFRHQYDSAMTQINEALSIDSNSPFGHLALGNFYQLRRKYEEAIVEYHKLIALGDSAGYAYIAWAYARSDNAIKAREILANLKAKYVPPLYFAWTYIALGDWDRAFNWLEKAYEEYDPYLTWTIAVPPGFDTNLDSFRTDPRFHTLVKKMGLEEVARRE
jgi:serine/threonine protein kinase/tetratricopeptide (TPR) repeat protein